MKKAILSAILLVLTAGIARSQSSAVDFTATDCAGTSHSLFTDLNDGKVVVIVWVMPCSMCINDALGAHDAVQTYASSHPGKVLYYLVDDVGNTDCGTLKAWASQNGISGDDIIFFGNAGSTIDENNYGGPGMPHVAVVGSDKKIYFNEQNGADDFSAIQQAIGQALNPTGVKEAPSQIERPSVYPNPARESIMVQHLSSDLSGVQLSVTNLLGQTVMTQTGGILTARKNELKLNISSLKNGVYFLNVNDNGSKTMIRFVIAR
jgi:hypothetical protein